MFEVKCLDSYGNTIDNFSQWDIDQKITISLNDCGDDKLSIAPMVHFSNKQRKREDKDALVVRSTILEGNTVVVNVPNILLQEPYPLLVYVYLTDDEDVSSQKTVLSTEIIVRKRPKPSNYYYVENIERITAQQIKEEIKKEVVDDINQNDISFKTVTLIDVVNNQPYCVYFSDGKIKFDLIDREKIPLNSITYTDRITSEKHSVYMSNGKLMFKLNIEGEV